MFSHELPGDQPVRERLDQFDYMAQLRGKRKLQTAVIKWATANAPALREAGLMQGLMEAMQKEIYE